jgi:hypothetical protein
MMRWTKRTTEEDSMARLRPAVVAVISTVLVLAGCDEDQPGCWSR